MKQLNFIIICVLTLPVLFFTFSFGQNKDTEPSEFLYSEQALKRLKKEIEIKNMSFDKSISGQLYFSVPQGLAVYLSLEGAKVAAIKKLIDSKADWLKIAALLDENAKSDTVYFTKYRTEEGVSFYPCKLNNTYRNPVHIKDLNTYSDDLSGTWVYSHSPKMSYSEESIDAMFILKELKPKPLPHGAITCIRYADHLIDTNITIFTKTATENVRNFNYRCNPAVDKLIKLTHNFPGKPVWKYEKDSLPSEKYYRDCSAWENARKVYVDAKLSKTKRFRDLLQAAYKETSEKDTAGHFLMDEFEGYVEKYVSASAALALKRKRIVVGGCSRDRSPIVHAANIARLAGETCCMEIFLRSHLNILYDRFDRVTDGSYAEPGRQTYAKELDVIGVKLEYLFPGTILTARNLSLNHYRGDLNRAGRALAELESRNMVYERIESLINTDSLDLYNRLLLTFLAESYNHYLLEGQQTTEATKNLTRLEISISSFPDYIKLPLKESIASIRNRQKE